MKERPILLNAEMVRAVLDGRKTQTCRIMKVQPDSAEFETRFIIDSTKRSEIGKWCWAEPGVFVNPRRSALFSCPFGAVGDRLWVRETFAALAWGSYEPEKPSWSGSCQEARYRATDRLADLSADIRGYGWRPSIHMPRWASRITLEITGVRVERLNSINEHDAIAEGLAEISKDGHTYKFGVPDRDGYPGTDDFGWPWHEWERYPISAYSKLWKSIYGEESWQANPWVWVIEFKRVEG
ncbi:hypothetical protein [Pantoea ananatis]|uniref:hypothetical protein n=1 Tax=Pantoea ananas TaxID=553 RepID=UPI00197E1A60|nr:hypothetical protein [Pantoea ananatis]MBN6029218.1 hypothetical protein [Pantoea ananatis]